MTVKSPEPNSKSQSVAWSSLVFVKNIIMNGPFLTLKFQSSLIINHNKSALLSPLPLLFSASSLFIYTRFSFGRMIDAQVWLFSLRLDWKGLIFNGIVCHLKTFSFAKNGTCVHTSWSKRGLKSSLSVLLFAHSQGISIEYVLGIQYSEKVLVLYIQYILWRSIGKSINILRLEIQYPILFSRIFQSFQAKSS